MPADWKNQLNELKPKLKSETPRPEPAPKADSAVSAAYSNAFISARVGSPNRAGRAPYNFVPPPKEVRWWKEKKGEGDIFVHDRYDPLRFSGYIDVTLKAISDFYVRGMRTLESYESGEEIRTQSRPFEVSGKIRLPGSSLRGMFRSVMEILAAAPLDPIDSDRQLFFRAVAASADRREDSFDANAVAYKQRITKGSGTRADPVCPIVKAGYLSTTGRTWTIQPAIVGPHGQQWYRADKRNDIESRDPVQIDFLPVGASPRQHPHSHIWFQAGVLDQTQWTHRGSGGTAHHKAGHLIQSGYMKGKYLQWIIHERDASKTPINVPPKDKEACLGDDNAKYPIKTDLLHHPCFYTEWQDGDGRPRISFGHTPHFRLPYEKTPGLANPARRDREDPWDMVQAILGRTEKINRIGCAGRVAFQDAFLISGGEVGQLETTVLGTPKPTTYQHYLRQRNDRKVDAIHWDDPDAQLRGFKRYFKRPTSVPAPPNNNPKTITTFCPAKKESQLKTRIRYENLTTEELGLLLSALELPVGCGHQLGMARPLGFGWFESTIEVFEIKRAERYRRFFESSEKLADGVSPMDAGAVAGHKDAFASWALGEDTGISKRDAWARLWDTPRMAELKALMLTDYPVREDLWKGATRYLTIQPLNEYLYIPGANGRRLPASRRPLPPASQVREAGDFVPKDDVTPPPARAAPPGGQPGRGRDFGNRPGRDRHGRI
jgi:CRISPR-associated protein (TIGR03986 family)